jgi:uncharacterized membrane protein
MAGLSYWILQRVLIANEGDESVLARATGRDFKGNLSLLIYALAIAMAFFNQWIAQIGYVLVAMMWLVPDKRIEKALAAHEK